MCFISCAKKKVNIFHPSGCNDPIGKSINKKRNGLFFNKTTQAANKFKTPVSFEKQQKHGSMNIHRQKERSKKKKINGIIINTTVEKNK